MYNSHAHTSNAMNEDLLLSRKSTKHSMQIQPCTDREMISPTTSRHELERKAREDPLFIIKKRARKNR